MKWILLAILIGLIVGGGGRRLASLFSTAKQLPEDFKRGQRRVDDPASEAKPLNDPPERR